MLWQHAQQPTGSWASNGLPPCLFSLLVCVRFGTSQKDACNILQHVETVMLATNSDPNLCQSPSILTHAYACFDT